MRIILYLCLLTSALYADDNELLNRLRSSIIHYYHEIHSMQTNHPEGIWYANYLATLFNNREKNLFYDYWTGYCNEELFEKVGGNIFKLREKASATDACRKLICDLTIMDCGNVSQLVYYLAISDLVGKKVFDAHAAQSDKPLFIATYTKDAPKTSLLFDFLSETKIPTPSKENARPLTLCQLCYFRNYTEYLIKHPTGNAQGYNSIYVGYNKNKEQEYISFWGTGPKTESEVIALLNERFFAPQDDWDLEYLAKHPDEKKENLKYDPDHQFFDDQHIYTYVINLEAIRKLIKN